MPTYERSAWEDLPPELLELILQRLTLMDYLKCREICSSWRKAVDNALATKGRCPPAPQLPFLLSLSPNNPAKLVSLNQHRVFTMSNQTWPSKIDKVYSVQGWLMFNIFHYVSEKDETCCEFSIFNPISRASFKLPELLLLWGRWTWCYVNRVAFTSAPPDSQDFLVVFLIVVSYREQVKQLLAFSKVTHRSWTSIETTKTRTKIFYNIAVHNGKLYAITANHGIGVVFVFNLGDHANAITVERLVMLSPIPTSMRGDRFTYGIKMCHLTNNEEHMLAMDTTNGELLLVFHLRDRVMSSTSFQCEYSRSTKGFRVFKLDRSGPVWSEIKQLGDRFLFLDCTGIRVMSTRDLDGTPEFNRGNCIFFCTANKLLVDSFPKHDLGVFFMADKSFTRFPVMSCLPSSLSDSIRDIWFSPNPW